MSGWTVAWIGWIAMFATVEGAALVTKKPGATLSAHVWAWFSIKGKSTGWRARRFVLAAFLAWLVLHFLTGGAF